MIRIYKKSAVLASIVFLLLLLPSFHGLVHLLEADHHHHEQHDDCCEHEQASSCHLKLVHHVEMEDCEHEQHFVDHEDLCLDCLYQLKKDHSVFKHHAKTSYAVEEARSIEYNSEFISIKSVLSIKLRGPPQVSA